MRFLFLFTALSFLMPWSKAQNFEDLTFGTDNSLEVITWNIQFFPHNDDLTVAYISQIIQSLNADIIAFQEVADVSVFQQMIDNIDGYEAFIGTTDDLIKLAYVYKTDVIQLNSCYEIYTGGEYYLPFLRRPLVMECKYEGKDFVIINNHFKAIGDGILDRDNPNDEENRRWVATNLVKEYIDNHFPNDNVIVLGDLNDVVTDEYPHNVFESMLDDSENYAFADYDLAVGSDTEWSYPDYPSHIDHIIITNELFEDFNTEGSSVSTLKIEDYFTGGWNDYKQNISDHRPVALKLVSNESVIFSKDFDDQILTSGGWTSHNITGMQTWTIPETQFGHNNSYCAYMNGYSNGAKENENWFVSPAFSPDDYNNLRLSFWNTSAYSGPGLQLYWSNNYSGDPQTAVWTEIDNVQWDDGITDWVWTFSEILDLSNLTGATAHIAFKYTSTSQQAAAWEIDDILLFDAGTHNNVKNVKKVSNGLAIDGHLEEEFWELSRAVTIDNGGSDNTAKFGLLWDQNYLYVGVEVIDNLLCNDRRQAFYTDGIEICVDGNHDQSTGFDDNDLQLAKAVKSFWVQEMNQNFDGIVHKYKETVGGYTMEFAIPWAIINTTPAAGDLVGFNLVVNDDDAESLFNGPFNRPAQLIWEGSSDYHQSPQNWGSIQLGEETVGFPGSYLALLSHNEGNYLINGKNTDIKWFSRGIDNIKIEYSTDSGIHWKSITESTDAATGIYAWVPDAPASEQFLFRISDASNSSVVDQSDVSNILSESFISSELLIPSTWQNYMWPFNAYYPEIENGINGHSGNGCGPSTLARLIHSWEFPRQGNSSLTFTDYYGTVWSANFQNTIYNYDNMPNHLYWNATEPEYADVATLFRDAQVAMEDVYGSGTDLSNLSYALSNYFNYKESDIAYMHDYTPAEWTQLLKNEIDNGRSLVIQAMNLNYFDDWHSSNNIGGHWYHCDGYNEEGEFHIVVGFGDYQYDGYYSIEEFPIFSYNVGILTGLEPDLNGKSLSVTKPNGGEFFTSGDQVEITWQSSNITKLQIEYSMDNGKSWIELEAAFDADAGNYLWTTPANNSDQCIIRLTDTDNINVYDKSDEVFDIMATQLAVNYPAGGESFVFDDTAWIAWRTTPLSEIDIEYSGDNGSTWNTIASNFDASQKQYKWGVPQSATKQGLVRISDSNDKNNLSLTDAAFSIVPPNEVGGPYSSDESTLLLLHAEGNLFNQSEYSGEVSSANGTIRYAESPIDDLGKSIYLDNSSSAPYLVVPHTSSLNLTGDWTIELWFKPVAYNPGLQYLIWKPGDDDEYLSNYSMQLNEFWQNELYAFYFSGEDRIGVKTQYFPALNEWYHIAFIRNTGNSSLSMILRDEQREIIDTYSMNVNGAMPLTNAQDLKIGFNFNGYLDEIRISDIVRSFESSPVDPTTVDRKIGVAEIILHPNPASEFIFLNNMEEVTISMYSTTGVCVKKEQIVQPNESLNISDLKNGIYFIQIETLNHTINKKIIVK